MTSWPAGLWLCCIFSLDVCCLLWLWRQRSTSLSLTDPPWTKKGPQQCSTELWEQTEFSGVCSWWTLAFIFVLMHIFCMWEKTISGAGIIWSFAAICRLIIVWCCVSFLCVQMRLFGKHELTFNHFWSSGFIWTAGQDAISHRRGTLLSHAFRINSVFACRVQQVQALVMSPKVWLTCGGPQGSIPDPVSVCHPCFPPLMHRSRSSVC